MNENRSLQLASFNPEIPDRREERQLRHECALYQRFHRDERIRRDKSGIDVERHRIRLYAKCCAFCLAFLVLFGALGVWRGTFPLPTDRWTFGVWREWTLGTPWLLWVSGFLMGAAFSCGCISFLKVLVHAVRLYQAKSDLAKIT